MAPYTGAVSKGILPYGHMASPTQAMVSPNGSNGAVWVRPFRALVGSRNLPNAGPRKNWRDIRSGLSVPESGSALATNVTFAANASGNPRWDLIVARVRVDVQADEVTRLVKDIDSEIVAPQNVYPFLSTLVDLQVVQGTAAASPVWPSAPSDVTNSTYYIPIAYVRIPNGFGSSSAVATTGIAVVAPCLNIHRALGVQTLSVADSHQTVTTADQQSWGSSGTRPQRWIPRDLCGGETLIAHVDLMSEDADDWSHQSGGVIDSRDWRGRLSKTTIMAYAGNGTTLPPPWALSELPTTGSHGWHPGVADQYTGTADEAHMITCFGSTMVPHEDTTRSSIAILQGDNFQYMTDSSEVALYVDHADGGKLKLNVFGSPKCVFHIWAEFTGSYFNK